MMHYLLTIHFALRFFFCATIFVAAGLRQSVCAQALVDPGFEKDLTEWQNRFDYNLSSASEEAARSGKLGLRIADESEQKGSSIESMMMDVEPGKVYEVSFWARTVSGTGAVAVSLIYRDDQDKELQKKKPGVLARPGPEWEEFRAKGKAPETANTVSVWIHSLALEMVTMDIDDFEISKAE